MRNVDTRIPILGLIFLSFAITPLAAQQNRLRIEWNDFAPQYRGQTDRRVTVVCPPQGTPSNVFGTGIYSDNSFVCSAATHAGVISPASGGAVTLVIRRGENAYQGSTQNGVTSQSRGAFAGSFAFETGNVPGQVDWTTTAVGLSHAGKPLTLICPPGGGISRVWGTDTYTEDSSICSAAAHAGHITAASGGTVRVESAGPQESFVGSARNGVTSLEWKAWPTSFRISPAAAGTSPQLAQTQSQAASSMATNVGVTLSATSGLVTTEAGGTATFSVKLSAQPNADIVVPLLSSRTGEGTVSPTSLTFTSSNWNTPQVVTIKGVDDFVVDGNQPYMVRTGPIQASGDSRYNGYDAADVSVTNSDDDAAGIVVSPSAGLVTSESGGTATFTIVLKSVPVGQVSISISSSNASEGTASPSSVVFSPANWSTPQTVTVTGVNDANADGNVAFTIVTGNASSTDAQYNNMEVADVGVTNGDDEKTGGTGAGAVDCTATSCGSSCADIAAKQRVGDGNYLIDPGVAKPFTVYCHNMRSAPTEYLAVSEKNVSAFDLSASECGTKCGNFQVQFQRLRLVLGRQIAIDTRDFTFTTDNRSETCALDNCDEYRMSWGAAGSCSDATGRSIFDLGGTPFVVDESAHTGGGGEKASGEVTFSRDRRSGSVTGGGFCGSFGFSSSPAHPVSANVPLRYSP